MPKLSEEYNLAVKHPKVAKEWHPTKNEKLIPSEVTPKSRKKVWWKCAQGHEWQTSISHRTDGRGCSICYNIRRGNNRD